MAAKIATYSHLDARLIFPLGYSVVARRPTGEEATGLRASRRRNLPELDGVRRFATLCFAADILAEPTLLALYGQHFSSADDTTLVIYAPHVDPSAAAASLSQLVTRLGLEGPDSPEMLALPYRGRAEEEALAEAVDGVLALQPPWGAFCELPWFHPGNLDELSRMVSAR